MADFSSLQAEVDTLLVQVTATEGIEASAVAAFQGFSNAISAAVTAALEADNAADNASVVAAQQAIRDVTARFMASGNALSAAIVTAPPVV